MYLTIGFWIAIITIVIYYAFYALGLFSHSETIRDLSQRSIKIYVILTPILIFGFVWVLYPLIFGVIFGITVLLQCSEQARDWTDELINIIP